jgi:hypothetical protein
MLRPITPILGAFIANNIPYLHGSLLPTRY